MCHRRPKGLKDMRRNTWAWVLGWIIPTLLGGGIAVAQAYPSDLEAALATGSPRLKLFALMQVRPEGGGELATALQRGLGLRHPKGAAPQVIDAGLSLAPVLDYDSNINGGTPGQTLNIGGLIFALTPESQAKSGLVMGFAPLARLRLSVGQGRSIEVFASGSVARALDYDLTRQTYGFGLCGAQYLGRADWVDICGGRRGAVRALSQPREDYISLALARQYASQNGYCEASLRLQSVDYGSFSKSLVDFGISQASARLGVLDWRVDLGEYIEGQHTRLAGLTLSQTRPIWGRQTTIFASGAYEGGATFFGLRRWDQAFGIGVSRGFGTGGVWTLSLQDRRSTLENYAGQTFGLSFSWALAAR